VILGVFVARARKCLDTLRHDGTLVASGCGMTEPQFKDREERDLSRGGKNTAILTLSVAAAVIVGGIALAAGIRQYVSPPERPGTTSGTTSAGETKPPSP
jgi:hypothetical protein